MKFLLLLAHPNTKSFNHAVAARVAETITEKGHTLFFHDLYAEGFDPLITTEELTDSFKPSGLLKTHCDQIQAADVIVVIHPNYRNQPPAILKGWVDRVIRSGVAFRYEGEEGEEGILKGILAARVALIINSADCPEAADRAKDFPLRQFWERDVFGGCGVGRTVYHSFYEVLFSDHQQRRRWIERAGALTESLLLPEPV